MINVTKSYLPAKEVYDKYIEAVWKSGWLTNNGPLVLDLEAKLRDYLQVKHCFFVNNGTIALQIAIRALDLKGEIITTPFSYIATSSCIVWEHCKPVFADIEPDTLTLDPLAIEAAITPATTGILATHVYGNPCDVEKIEAIAAKHNLKVIYDAAHAFGVKYKGQSVLNFGDISTLSFHATKLFHTIEGGAIVTNDDALAHKISYMRNFGHNGPEAFWGMGINGKSSEFNAAMGLSILPDIEKIIAARKHISTLYKQLLAVLGHKVTMLSIRPGTEYNYAYFPVTLESETVLLKVRDALNAVEIFPRRYFYPSLNTIDYLKQPGMLVSEDVSTRVMCLPLFFDLTDEQVAQISNIIIGVLK